MSGEERLFRQTEYLVLASHPDTRDHVFLGDLEDASTMYATWSAPPFDFERVLLARVEECWQGGSQKVSGGKVVKWRAERKAP